MKKKKDNNYLDYIPVKNPEIEYTDVIQAHSCLCYPISPICYCRIINLVGQLFDYL